MCAFDFRKSLYKKERMPKDRELASSGYIFENWGT